MAEVGTEYLNQKSIKGFFDVLPKMVVSHSKRVSNIAKFLVKKFEVEDFFFDLHVNQGSFLDACLYHDVGKGAVAQEYLFRELCTSPYETHKYMEHVQFGLDIIDDENIEQYVIEHPNNFKSYFYQVLKYHHGPLKNKFPIIGQIAYIADTIDNSFFKVASNTVVELNDRSFESVWKKLLTIFNSDGVHQDILRIFVDPIFMSSFEEFLDKLYKRTTTRTRYGLYVNDYNIYDIYKLGDASSKKEDEEIPLKYHQIFARKISYNINTRYYGKILHEEFIYVALKNKLTKKLDGAFFSYIKDKLKECYEDKQVLTFIGLTVESMNRLTNKRITKIVDELCIAHNDIGILIDLYYDELTEVQANAIKELKLAGFKVAINQARAEYINIFNDIQFDYAFYDNASVAQADEIFIELLQSLGTVVILNEKGDDKYRYICSTDANFRRGDEDEVVEHPANKEEDK